MTSVYALSLLLIGQGAPAPAAAEITAKEVSALVGNWSGPMVIHSPARKDPMKITMSIEIQPIKNSDKFSYKLTYEKQPTRDYVLQPIDPTKGHWQVDEQNGIKLDAFWNGAGFTSVFTVQGTTIVTTERLEGGKLHWENISYAGKPFAETGNVQGAPPVSTFRVLNVQRAVLTRK